MRKNVRIGFLITPVILVLAAVSLHFYFHHHSPVIAVIDSGLDLSKFPELKNRLAPGTRPEALTDSAGHGSEIASTAARLCEECKILPVKITEEGGSTQPDDLAAAIRFSAEMGARVINVSLGLHGNSAAVTTLHEAVKAAAQSGILIVAAAGAGLANPFRPEPLSQIFPQAFSDVLVVGSPDPLSNHGPEIDLAVKAKSSSAAAAMVSGIAAKRILRDWNVTPGRLRHGLRQQTTPITPFDFNRIGYGMLCPASTTPARSDVAFRAYDTQADFSMATDIRETGWSWDCTGSSGGEPPLTSNTLKKGRARIQWIEPFSLKNPECRLRIILVTNEGKRHQLFIRYADIIR
ncbi:MAG: hypothetical protein A2X94_12605 [Bdellovibrionales bacterium GWB1_55_8]|nr:MAG: hypothetical protein A2X94_12605 [Bdellovibrionales bacterium GWB1_55_8]